MNIPSENDIWENKNFALYLYKSVRTYSLYNLYSEATLLETKSSKIVLVSQKIGDFSRLKSHIFCETWTCFEGSVLKKSRLSSQFPYIVTCKLLKYSKSQPTYSSSYAKVEQIKNKFVLTLKEQCHKLTTPYPLPHLTILFEYILDFAQII